MISEEGEPYSPQACHNGFMEELVAYMLPFPSVRRKKEV
jgi:hypothetical protein